mgnify:FL=1
MEEDIRELGGQVTLKHEGARVGSSASWSYLGRTLRKSVNGDLDLSMGGAYASALAKELEILRSSENIAEPPEDATPLNADEVSRLRHVVGVLRWVSTERPDLLSALSKIGLASPTRRDWALATRVVQYLLRFPSLTVPFTKRQIPITFPGRGLAVDIFTDSSWGGNALSGWVVYVDSRVVSYGCRKQKVVALSSCEAEYYAASSGVVEGLGTVSLLEEVAGEGITRPGTQGDNDQGMAPSVSRVSVSLYMDSSSARSLCGRVGVGKVRHLSTRMLWLQELVQSRRLSVKKVHTEVNVSDLMTKLPSRRTRATLMPMLLEGL